MLFLTLTSKSLHFRTALLSAFALSSVITHTKANEYAPTVVLQDAYVLVYVKFSDQNGSSVAACNDSSRYLSIPNFGKG